MADINAHVQDQCYKRLAEKVENLKPINHKFKPFQTLKREQDPSLKQFHKWDENTAATPPILKYNNGVKTIQIEESLELQVKVEEKRKVLNLNTDVLHAQSCIHLLIYLSIVTGTREFSIKIRSNFA